MVASILAKKKTAGATHVAHRHPGRPDGQGAHRDAAAQQLGRAVPRASRRRSSLHLDVRHHRGPRSDRLGHRPAPGSARRPRCAAPRARTRPRDLREKSLFLAGAAARARRRRAADRRATARRSRRSTPAPPTRAFERIVAAQGARAAAAARRRHRDVVEAPADGRIREIDCWEIARVAKRAGAPANVAAGVRLLRTVGDVARGEPLFEIHAQSRAQLEFARSYARPRSRRSCASEPRAVRF